MRATGEGGRIAWIAASRGEELSDSLAGTFLAAVTSAVALS
jgi:hypothetical protein